MYIFLLWSIFCTANQVPQQKEIAVVNELYRLRNEHKADSASMLFAERVTVYMKYMRNVTRKKIADADRAFWKADPQNRFEITSVPVVQYVKGNAIVSFSGKEYLDGIDYRKERIEVRIDAQGKIFSLRGFSVR